MISVIPKLRDLWGRAAGELEDSWAHRILSSGSPTEGINLPSLVNLCFLLPFSSKGFVEHLSSSWELQSDYTD